MEPFAIKDCALSAISIGRRAQNLKELRDNIQTIPLESIYYHFWGGRLRPYFNDPEFNNDFAAWARHALHDHVLAERLSVIDPTDFPDLEDLRSELVDVIEERLDESLYVPWAKTDQQLFFIRSQLVVFNTRKKLERPEDIPDAVANMTISSVFYHFIDARRREPVGLDDFRRWLLTGEETSPLADALASIDPYFTTLTELRSTIVAATQAALSVS